MESLLVWLMALLFLVIALLIVARLLAFASHAIGLNPPEWLLETGLPNPPSRFASAIMVLASVYFVASLFFELPFFDLFTETNGAAQ